MGMTTMMLAGFQPALVHTYGYALDEDRPVKTNLAATDWHGSYRLDIFLTRDHHHIELSREGVLVRAETVGAYSPYGAGLPDELSTDGYQFASEYRVVRGAVFSESVEVLKDRVTQSDTACQVLFSESPDYVRAVEWFWTPSAVGWETHHCFPYEEKVIVTRSLCELR